MSDEKISVFIVDDHDLFRAGVRGALPDDVEVVGEASDTQAATRGAPSAPPAAEPNTR